MILPRDNWSPSGNLGRHDSGRAKWRHDDAHTQAHFFGCCGEVGDEGRALQEFATRAYRECVRKLFHRAKRFGQLHAIGRFGNNDTIERPDGIEIERFGGLGQRIDFVNTDLVSEIRHIQGEFHG